MSNTRKEWANMSSDEKFVQIFVNIFCNFVWVFALHFMYFDSTSDAWAIVHPTTFADIIGTAFLIWCCFWLSGVWGYVIKAEDDDNPILGTITKVSWALGVIGVFLICLL
jgi:hypothetical protein